MVVDTGIFIEHLRIKNKTASTLFKLADSADLFISAVSLYELYMGATTKEKEMDVQNITEDLSVLPFTDVIAQKAAEIYHQLKRNNQLIEFRDIFIAATCIVNDLPLVTLNKKHFQRIDGLEILK
ncbi:type II toxin-antitoxin system VapC family toxin [Pedobacter sp. MC2016-15]|uniref:type II toxin-antitoxin system VapC family toxin n=1 Tax=Pedobacter sp. MC2016-15 TaxID=2994473 RepID=UPI00224764F1|nr:type II toxin-antitoxin system VapC family toxin [Pedobacter sp. MC2016-15]MCX2481851.1 type II toxin-antitoxin system VapC family toxin [Pedobacter sp. MC2016-15]